MYDIPIKESPTPPPNHFFSWFVPIKTNSKYCNFKNWYVNKKNGITFLNVDYYVKTLKWCHIKEFEEIDEALKLYALIGSFCQTYMFFFFFIF